jgi:hypothetical protein
MLSAVGSAHTRPGHFVYIDFSTPVRLCSRGDTVWQGQSWVGVGLSRPVYQGDANGIQSGRLTATALDASLLALCLGEGIADRAVRIWAFDAAALATSDPVLEFDGVGDSCTGDAQKVTFALASERAGVLFAPNLLCIPGNGFNHLPQRGQVVAWGNEVFEFD